MPTLLIPPPHLRRPDPPPLHARRDRADGKGHRKARYMTDYPYLPVECRTGACDHDPDRCLRFRSRRCESGQCTHARQNLLCAVNYPTESSEATR
ncbi:hypothetical protein GCM10009601_51600 [Streptomyces thermospinosisporus]|uniref:Uncharacterized protein n=2 Tax=Streptomyces thermospinosisporus TaxID=161482 RepID=A0ABN1Z4Q9_9ACTN